MFIYKNGLGSYCNKDHSGLNQYSGSGNGENLMKGREIQKTQFQGLVIIQTSRMKMRKKLSMEPKFLIGETQWMADKKMTNSSWENYE